MPLLAANQVVLVDARSGPEARQQYQQLHLAGARHVDLDQDLAAKVVDAANGGRHPLPPIEQFAKLLGSLGIQPNTHVVVYDDKNGANAAARFWWMLRAAGHTQVQVLDGGLPAALSAGLPTASGLEAAGSSAPYPTSGWQWPTATAADVQQATQTGQGLVIDVREARRFRGEIEPIDLVAGHIPGAVNVPFTDNLDAEGNFLSPQALKEKYSTLIDQYPAGVIVHCGSGVTACHTLLAIDYAGLEVPKLYVGSWSEWSRNEHPIATGD
ncbi:sulfurtransferase [Hymenobacter sp. YC55]|uniref:sulfurtransferase n=1 Tax=Hymenobacter sp. YC55 TaxID=3034019 RepID=UPI0023F82EAC|nr:sulfurtransferase [Hymenobacter sp. YC55]MDF7811825.1 sulfurtransferase [Hymenobacter sp. YC55]